VKTHGKALIQGEHGMLLGYLYKPFELSATTGNLFVAVNISISILHSDYIDMYEESRLLIHMDDGNLFRADRAMLMEKRDGYYYDMYTKRIIDVVDLAYIICLDGFVIGPPENGELKFMYEKFNELDAAQYDDWYD